MAHTKAAGTTKGNRDSIAKRLGVKIFAGEKVIPGNILVRQKGSQFHSGLGTKMGNDFTIFATSTGTVQFLNKKGDRVIQVA